MSLWLGCRAEAVQEQCPQWWPCHTLPPAPCTATGRDRDAGMGRGTARSTGWCGSGNFWIQQDLTNARDSLREAGNKVKSFYSQFISAPLVLPFEAGLGHGVRKLKNAAEVPYIVRIHPSHCGKASADSNPWVPWKEGFARTLPLISRE